MNSLIASTINEDDSDSHLAVVGSRLSLLASETIDFLPSEHKINFSSSVQKDKNMTTVIGNKDSFNVHQKQMNSVDLNKNTLSNSYSPLNVNKEKILVNGNKEKILVNGNKEKILVNGNKEKIVLNGSREKLNEDSIPTPKTLLYTGKILVEWKQVHKIGAGLNNLGNTCFMNTVIQCLTYCPPLANYLLHDNDHPSKCTITGFCMMCLLQKHMRRTIGKTGDIIKPIDVYQRLKLIAKHFQFGRQEDAHEFLRYVIDNLVKSCLAQGNGISKLDAASKETTVINQIFGGYHRSQVTCLKCKGKSNTYDHFMDFILDIKQNVMSLEKALEKFIQPELLEQDNSYKCPKCKMKVSAQKRFTVYKAPNVATFQLKRFDYQRSFGGKITKQITYPEKLNLRPYMSESKGDPVWYRLNAVLVHAGQTCNSGHYYCYVRNSNGLWYIMDDQRVCQVSITQVMSQSAYVLFYIKITSNEGPPIKKSFENRNSFIKVNSPACNYKKVPEQVVKASPLSNHNQARQSSPQLKQHIYPTVNLPKRNGLSPQVNREKISFGIRPIANTSQYGNKSASPAKKIKSSKNTSKINTSSPGLVPYNEDSSDSDENDNRIVNSDSTERSASNCVDSAKLNSGNKSFVNFDVRRKLSKSVLSVPSSTSTSPKVIATSSWTVTDARSSSPGADSNSSFNSVHSTTDWHVTCTETNKFIPMTPSKKNKEEITVPVTLPENAPLLSNGNRSSSPVHSVNKFNDVINLETPPPSDMGSSTNGISPNQTCDFRKQEPESNKAFRSEKENLQSPQQNSFLKRKHSDSDQKYSTNSKFDNCENQYSSIPKKNQLSLDSDSKYKSTERNGFKNEHSSSSYYKSPETTNGKKVERDSRGSRDSSLEYEWVEKTHNNPEKEHFSSKGQFYQKGKYSGESSKFQKTNQKPDVVKELNKNSKYFYGASVPTWKGEVRYKDIISSNNEKRKSFEEYEDDYDRGKTRKYRQDHRYHPYQKQNFHKRNNRNYNHHKYENRHYNDHHYDRSYNSHPKWKQNSHHYFQKRKFFKSHFH